MYSTELPIRDDLRVAHQSTVNHWAQPGTWWTATERLAIIARVREARDAKEVPPPWVSAPEMSGSPLPAVANDVIWRLTHHPGTVTEPWCQTILDRFGDDEAASSGRYTELVALVAQANNLDRFADALSLGRLTLPAPAEGEPSRKLPTGLALNDHWVPTVAEEGAAVTIALSGVPAENEASFRLSDAGYLPVDQMSDYKSDRNALTRMQVELVAARTSKLNECFY